MLTKPITQPVLFVGHGSPMNIIQTNNYTKSLDTLSKRMIKPKAILIISAHWITSGTHITYSDDILETIYDFGGFPKELYQQKYLARGSKKIADVVQNTLSPINLTKEENHGLDHGSWSVLKHIFPSADIPVVALSIDGTKGPQYHYELGKKLAVLRSQNILIISSGNLIHSFQEMEMDENAKPKPWALEFQAEFLDKLNSGEWDNLIDFHKLNHYQKAINTADHYFPIFYALGASNSNEKVTVIFDEIQHGSMSMLTLGFGSLQS